MSCYEAPDGKTLRHVEPPPKSSKAAARVAQAVVGDHPARGRRRPWMDDEEPAMDGVFWRPAGRVINGGSETTAPEPEEKLRREGN